MSKTRGYELTHDLLCRAAVKGKVARQERQKGSKRLRDWLISVLIAVVLVLGSLTWYAVQQSVDARHSAKKAMDAQVIAKTETANARKAEGEAKQAATNAMNATIQPPSRQKNDCGSACESHPTTGRYVWLDSRIARYGADVHRTEHQDFEIRLR